MKVKGKEKIASTFLKENFSQSLWEREISRQTDPLSYETRVLFSSKGHHQLYMKVKLKIVTNTITLKGT